MTADFPVVLDACVLVPASLRDTLLRCAERRMYLPRWSNEILDELRRTLLEKLGRSAEQVDHLVNELNRYFTDARVEGFETLVALMTNDPGDRHVIAAAVKCGAEAIVTFNLRHIPDAALDTWAQNQLCPKEPPVMVVLDWFKIEERTQGFGDFFLPLAFGIHTVYRDHAKFLAGITFAHGHIPGECVVFSKCLLESTLNAQISPHCV